METITINSFEQLGAALKTKQQQGTNCTKCGTNMPDRLHRYMFDDQNICIDCYNQLQEEAADGCDTCGGDGGYYEDVAGDGGSRMFVPCDDCFEDLEE